MFPLVLGEVFSSLAPLRGISSESVPARNCWLIQTNTKNSNFAIIHEYKIRYNISSLLS